MSVQTAWRAGPGRLVGQTDRVLEMKKETKRRERGRVFIRFMWSRSCCRVGEFPRTLSCSPGRNRPLSCWTQTANEPPSHTHPAAVLAPPASNVAPRQSNLRTSGAHLDCTENVVPLIKICHKNDNVGTGFLPTVS